MLIAYEALDLKTFGQYLLQHQVRRRPILSLIDCLETTRFNAQITAERSGVVEGFQLHVETRHLRQLFLLGRYRRLPLLRLPNGKRFLLRQPFQV